MANWREDQGVVGRSYILRIIQEGWRNLKPSFLRYHRGLRGELEVGWIQNLRIELEPACQHLLGEEWRNKAEEYIRILEEEEQKKGPHNPKKEEKKKEIKKVEIQRKKK